jgi:hypothetical protein
VYMGLLPFASELMPRWIPADPDNWALMHLERAEKLMWRRGEIYESKVDFDALQKSENLFRRYIEMRDVVVGLANGLDTDTDIPL